MLPMLFLLFFVILDDAATFPQPRQPVNDDVSIADHALINVHSDLTDISLPGNPIAILIGHSIAYFKRLY